jgi:DNA-directed RNA polymerase specialized sigma24 family protein
MRRVLGDYARRRKAVKRPQIDNSVDVDHLERTADPAIDRMIAIDEALDRLSRADARQGRVAELKLFANLEIEEIATLLGVSVATVKRDWKGAKPVLRDILAERPRDPR